jgi:ribosomal protein L21
MYAVIKSGGKQHKVKVGDVIEVERLVGQDETVTFQPLLVVQEDRGRGGRRVSAGNLGSDGTQEGRRLIPQRS